MEGDARGVAKLVPYAAKLCNKKAGDKPAEKFLLSACPWQRQACDSDPFRFRVFDRARTESQYDMEVL